MANNRDGQSAELSACLANKSVHAAETKAKKQGSFYFLKSVLWFV